MVSFFQATWLIWWVFAIVLIVRWVHAVSANRAGDKESVYSFDDSEPDAGAPPLSSSWPSSVQA